MTGSYRMKVNIEVFDLIQFRTLLPVKRITMKEICL